MTLIKPVSETALYAPIKRFLGRPGFEVKGEICGCDIVGLAPGEPPLVVVTELKLSFSLELLLQAVERTRSSDIVYVAVPAARRGRDQDRRVHRLCRLLGLGLLAVDLKREVPEALKPRRIAIGGSQAALGQDNAPAQVEHQQVEHQVVEHQGEDRSKAA